MGGTVLGERNRRRTCPLEPPVPPAPPCVPDGTNTRRGHSGGDGKKGMNEPFPNLTVFGVSPTVKARHTRR